MKLFAKIRAFFTIKGKQEQMDLVSAEVNQEGVILHPLEDPEHSFFVRSDSIDIFINPGTEFSDDDVIILDNPAPLNDESLLEEPPYNERSAEEEEPPEPRYHIPHLKPQALSKFMPSKKRFSVMLYPDEYEMLMKNISDNGYKKVEYFLACMTSAKKQNMNAIYKRYTVEHAKRRQADLTEAKRAQTEDYLLRRAEAEQAKE